MNSESFARFLSGFFSGFAGSEASNAKRSRCSAALHEEKGILMQKNTPLAPKVWPETVEWKKLEFSICSSFFFVPSFASVLLNYSSLAPRNQLCGQFKAFGWVFKIYAQLFSSPKWIMNEEEIKTKKKLPAFSNQTPQAQFPPDNPSEMAENEI